MAQDWTRGDYELVRKARNKDGFLHALDPERFAYREPVILIVCSNWERRYDMVQHLAYLRGFSKTEDPRVHLFAWHGGPVRLAPCSPTNGGFMSASRIFLREVSDTLMMTGFKEVMACGHWPCRKCIQHGLNVREAMRQLVAVKYLIEKENPGTTVRTPFHLDYGDQIPKGMRSYHLNPRICLDQLEIPNV